MIHNILTLSRLISSPIIFLSLKQNNIKLTIILSIYAICSDFLDGFFAKLLKKESEFGAIFDVIADKIFLYCSIFGVFLFQNIHKSILLFIIIWMIRDCILVSLYFFKKAHFKSLLTGKIYTVLQFSFIFTEVTLNKNKYFSIFSNIFFMLFLILGLASMFAYYKLFSNE